MKLNRIVSVILVVVMIISCAHLTAYAEQSISAYDDQRISTSLDSEAYVAIDAVPECMDYGSAIMNKYVKRLYAEESDLKTAVFENIDGSKSACIFEDNIKYIDKDGSIKDKSNRLSKVEGGFLNKSNDINMFYRDSAHDGVEVSFEEYKFKMIPLSVEKNAYSAKLLESEDSSVPNRIVYEDVFGDSAHLIYTQNMSGMSEEIVLDKDIGVTEFGFLVTTENLILEACDDVLNLLDSNTEQKIAEMGSVIMWDSRGICSKGRYIIKPAVKKNAYMVTIDASALLENDDTVFPVTVHNNYDLDRGKEDVIQDATIFTNYNQNFGTWFSTFVGNYNAWYTTSTTQNQRGIARSLIKFNNTGSQYFLHYESEGTITSIKYNFADIDCTSGPNTIEAYLMDMDWDETNVQYSTDLWNAHSLYIGSTTISPTPEITIPYPRYEIDITTAVKLWRNGSKDNYGMMLKAKDESLKAVVLGTSESGTSASGRKDSKPYIVINYTPKWDNLVYRIKNSKSNLYMTVAKGYNSDKQNVYQSSRNDSRFAQEFRIVYDVSESAWRIHPICSMNGRRRVLDVKKSASGIEGLTSGCNLQIFKPTDDISQLFLIEDVGGRRFKIVLKNAPNLAITAYGTGTGSDDGRSSTSTGNIYMSEYTGAESQRWLLERSDRNDEELYYSLMNIRYPFDSNDGALPLRVSSSFAYRKHPVTGKDKAHSGIDIPASSGRKLYSLFDGIVKKIRLESSTTNGRGHYIIVEATDDCNNVYRSTQKLRYVYMHMKERPSITNPAVVENAFVSAGDLIGKVGTTGASTGNHLHLGIIFDGGLNTKIENTINPMMFYPDIKFTY